MLQPERLGALRRAKDVAQAQGTRRLRLWRPQKMKMEGGLGLYSTQRLESQQPTSYNGFTEAYHKHKRVRRGSRLCSRCAQPFWGGGISCKSCSPAPAGTTRAQPESILEHCSSIVEALPERNQRAAQTEPGIWAACPNFADDMRTGPHA